MPWDEGLVNSLVYDAPLDAWFAVSDAVVRPVGEAAGEVLAGLRIPALREQIEANFFAALARDLEKR